MAHPETRSDVSKKVISEQLKRNDDMFRNTMERIFQKYSNLDEPGPEVCLRTMSFTSGKGSVPLDSFTAEKEMQLLRKQLKERSLQALDSPQEEHTLLDQDMDVTMVDHDRSSQKENSSSCLWSGSETSRLSLKSMSWLWSEPSQPEEDDRNLERTLNSHGSTLLDVYPSMLNQIGEAYRRQHMTDVASAVLRRYRRRRWQSNHNHGYSNSYNNTQNRARDNSLAAPKPPCDDLSNNQKSKFRYQGSSPHTSDLECSPPKCSRDRSLISTTYFYSPRRDDVEKRTGVDRESCWTEESLHRPIRVLDLSTPSPGSSSPRSLSPACSSPRSPSPDSSSARSPSPDFNQTYIVESVPLPKSHGVPTSSVCNSTWSPLKMARMASLASQGGTSANSPPSYYRTGLQRDVCSLAASPQRNLSGHLFQMRSPLKAKTISLEQSRPPSVSCPKQASPMIRTSEGGRSPYKSQKNSPRLQLSHYQEKRRPSFSSHYAPSPSISRVPSRLIDAEFMSLYHHFICRSTNPTSSCHLCKRRSGAQSPAVTSTHSMSALSLTPVRNRLKKRHREPEVVESLRFKRFRESCSPRRTPQFRPQQQPQQPQGNGYMNSTVVEPSEDKYTWNRALLLQCPSPGFLGGIRRHQTSASGSNSKGPGSRHDPQTHLYSSSWRDSLGCEGASQTYISEAYAGTRSPVRTWDQSGVSVSPRLSRRRLLYGPLQ